MVTIRKIAYNWVTYEEEGRGGLLWESRCCGEALGAKSQSRSLGGQGP